MNSRLLCFFLLLLPLTVQILAGRPPEIIVQAASPTQASKPAAGEQLATAPDSIPSAQDTDPLIAKEKLVPLLQRIEQQQKEIEDNQIKTASQIAEIYELVRQAHVFSTKAAR